MFDTARRGFIYPLLLAITVLLAGCGDSQESRYQPSFAANKTSAVTEYVVGIHPLHNPKRLLAVYGPIVDYMNRHSPGAHFKLEASRNYEEFDKKLYAGHFDFAMPNPYQTVRSLQYGYRVFGKMADDDDFRGIILVRRDSGIREVSDLKGKAVSYPAITALAATMQPQYYLQTHGLDVNRDIENRYVGSQESSIMNVFRGDVAAGTTWPLPWKTFVAEHPQMAGQLVVQWKTEPLVNNGWVVREGMAASVTDKFSSLLFHLHESAEGREMLARMPVSRFEAASEETYERVHSFLQKFSETVRPIEH